MGRERDLHGQLLLKLFSEKNEIQEEEFQARQKWLESPNGQSLVIIGQMINTGVGDRFPNTSSHKKLILRMLKGLRDYRYIRQHVFVIFNCIIVVTENSIINDDRQTLHSFPSGQLFTRL